MDDKFIETLKKKSVALNEERARLNIEVQKIHNRIANLNGAIAGIDQLLLLEGANLESSSPAVSASPIVPSSVTQKSLAEVLPMILANKGYRTLDEIVELANKAGFDFGNKHPKKAVGFTLLGLGRGDKFERDEASGKWRYIG